MPATTPESASSASRLGTAIRPLKKSASAQTRSTFREEPIRMNSTTIRLYTLVYLEPNRALKLTWPKKYQPKMVENAKNSMQMAMNTLPKEPNVRLNAAWVRAVPVMPSGIRPEVISTRAVRVRMTKVSTNTPMMASAPWSCGCLTLASAWACGVEPRPASLENRPRATP